MESKELEGFSFSGYQGGILEKHLRIRQLDEKDRAAKPAVLKDSNQWQWLDAALSGDADRVRSLVIAQPGLVDSVLHTEAKRADGHLGTDSTCALGVAVEHNFIAVAKVLFAAGAAVDTCIGEIVFLLA